MRSDKFRLSPRLRVWTYGTFGLLFASGLLWWLIQRWGRVETEFGPAPLAGWPATVTAYASANQWK